MLRVGAGGVKLDTAFNVVCLKRQILCWMLWPKMLWIVLALKEDGCGTFMMSFFCEVRNLEERECLRTATRIQGMRVRVIEGQW